MPAAKLFLAADHKQAIFMLTNGGKHAMPVALLLPSLVKYVCQCSCAKPVLNQTCVILTDLLCVPV